MLVIKITKDKWYIVYKIFLLPGKICRDCIMYADSGSTGNLSIKQ